MDKKAFFNLPAFGWWLLAGFFLIPFAYFISVAINPIIAASSLDSFYKLLISLLPAGIVLGWLFSIFIIKYSGGQNATQ